MNSELKELLEMAKNQSVETQRMKYYIHSLICIAIMFGFQFIPPFTDTITQTGMNALGIFLGVLYGWSFVSMIWPSLLGMVACGFTGLMTMQESFFARLWRRYCYYHVSCFRIRCFHGTKWPQPLDCKLVY